MRTPEDYAHGIIAKINAGIFDPFSGSKLYDHIVSSIAAARAEQREVDAKISERSSFPCANIAIGDVVCGKRIAAAIRTGEGDEGEAEE